jgi:hypothetical protein
MGIIILKAHYSKYASFYAWPMIQKFQLIQDYVNLELLMQIDVEYDCEVILPLLLIVYKALTPILSILNLLVLLCLNWAYLGHWFILKKLYWGSSKLNYFLWNCSAYRSIQDPLNWWVNHEQFPDLLYLVCQIMGIFCSQIETEKYF